MRAVLEDHSVPGAAALTIMPSLHDMDALAAFLTDLRNIGMDPHTAGPVSLPEMTPGRPDAQELG